MGLIGCKGMGYADLSSILKINVIDVVALYDVDDSVLAEKTVNLQKAA